MNKEAFIRLKQAIEDYFVQLHVLNPTRKACKSKPQSINLLK